MSDSDSDIDAARRAYLLALQSVEDFVTERSTILVAISEISRKRCDADKTFGAYLALANELGLAKPALTTSRRQRLKAIIAQHGEDGWRSALDAIRRSSFLRGDKGGWSITLDWLLKPDNFAKVIEGNYSDKPQPEYVGGYKIEDLTDRPLTINGYTIEER